MAKMGLVLVMVIVLSLWAIFLSGLHSSSDCPFRLLGAGILGTAIITVDFDGNLEPSFQFRRWVTRWSGSATTMI